MKNFLSFRDFSGDELLHILDRADYLEKHWKANTMPHILQNRQVGLWFDGPGFRNRAAFEIGARGMGASVTYIPGELGVHEPIEDMGHYLDNWFSILVVRAKKHTDLLKLAETTDSAVINARTNFNHPCEILGDLQFIRKHRGSLEDVSLVFAGAVTNVCMSWFEAAVSLPITVIQIAPEGYEVPDKILAELNEKAAGKITISHELEPFLKKADVLYTDCWPRAQSHDEAQKIQETFLPYQIQAAHISQLQDTAVFLPCPPVTRGQEVSHDAMNSDLCKNHEAKAHLLHSQNAVLEFVRGVL